MEVVQSGKMEIKVLVDGKEFTQIPDDLFIPPDALEVLLDSFSGPLDLLLYLIRKQNIDILDIPMTVITNQYLQYIQLMECRRLELAADYLLMAAMLSEIKSRLLLPVTPSSEEEQEEDPRMVLVKKLQAYEQIKLAAQLLDALPRHERDHFAIQINRDAIEPLKLHPEVQLNDLREAMSGLLKREQQFAHHQITQETLSVRERMAEVLHQLHQYQSLEFTQLFKIEEGRMGLIVTLLAVLELARQSLIVVTQNQAFSPIHLQAA